MEGLAIALTAAICGGGSCVEFADFAEEQEEAFREFLILENGLPSHGTFSRRFRLIHPDALSCRFGRVLDALGAERGGAAAIDGKTLRRSFHRAAGASPLHVATAFHWRMENGLRWVLGVAFDDDRARNRKRKRSGWSDAFVPSVLGQMR